MKDFFQKNKTFLLIGLGTLVILLGGIFLFSKPTPTTDKKVSDTLLIPENAIKTAGIVNGEYIPASTSASVNLVEFGDYQCPACGIYNPMVKQLLTDFAGKITFVFRNYPLPQHANAKISSYAVLAANNQGKYWQMHDKLFENQNDWSSSTDAKTIFVNYAKELGLDTAKFLKDIDSPEVKDIVDRDYNDGNIIGLSETPTYYLNGQKLKLSGKYEDFKALIESALKK